jgi:L-threonylcarbamoyladenylate synthase
MKKTIVFKQGNLSAQMISRLAAALEKGAVGVFPTDTVYGIGTGALCEQSILSIYELKKRPATAPLQILTSSPDRALDLAKFPPHALCLARKYWPGALTLVLPPAEKNKNLARGFNGLGIRVPKHDFLGALLDAMVMPMATTSANLHGQPVWTQETPVLQTFHGKVDFIVLGGRLSPTASSVVDCCTGKPVLLREGQILRSALERTMDAPLAIKK